MYGKTRRNIKTPKWAALFSPADTTSQGASVHYRNCYATFGRIKCWFWIIISILLGLSIGQL